MKKLFLFSIIFLVGCRSQKEATINYVDTIKVSIPVEVPEKTSNVELQDSSLFQLSAGDSLTRETDTTILIVYKDTGSFRIKTIFKQSFVTADTIIKIDTVLKVKFRDCPERKQEKSFLDKVKKHFFITLIVLSLLLLIIVLILFKR